MPAGASWTVERPSTQVGLELVISGNLVTILVRGCRLDEITLTDRSTGEVQTAA
jgi:hypothetical protein